MPKPPVIQGPALIQRGTLSVYTEGDVTINYKRETWPPKGAIAGDLGPRLKSTAITVSARPIGMISAALLPLYWPHGPADIGKSILAEQDLVVIPLEGNKLAFPRSGISRMPSLKIGPSSTAYSSDIEFLCLGDPAIDPAHPAYFQSLAATAPDANFDESKVISPRVTVAFGAAPFDAMEPEDGIAVDYGMSLKALYAANCGQIDAILETLTMTARFQPIELTEAQYAALLRLQDAGALRPGDSIGSAADLVITGPGLAALTLKSMGAADGRMRFGTGRFRPGELTFHNVRKWTAGVAEVLYTIA